jgi:hypothetical protein
MAPQLDRGITVVRTFTNFYRKQGPQLLDCTIVKNNENSGQLSSAQRGSDQFQIYPRMAYHRVPKFVM